VRPACLVHSCAAVAENEPPIGCNRAQHPPVAAPVISTTFPAPSQFLATSLAVEDAPKPVGPMQAPAQPRRCCGRPVMGEAATPPAVTKGMLTLALCQRAQRVGGIGLFGGHARARGCQIDLAEKDSFLIPPELPVATWRSGASF
jgi:hypothetical protein